MVCCCCYISNTTQITISYIIQFTLFVILGPIFIGLYSLRGRGFVSQRAVRRLEKLQDTFIDVSSQFTITITIAAVVRTKQNAPFFEITFIESLTMMQFAGFFASVVAAGVTAERKKPFRIVIFVLYGFMNFGFYMGIVGYLYTSRSRFQDIKDLSIACQGYGFLLPAFTYARSLKLTGISAKVLLGGILKLSWNSLKRSIGQFFSIIIYLLLPCAAVFLLYASAILVWFLYKALISKNAYILGGMSLAFTVWALVELVEMMRKRDILKSLSGDAFHDNKWGFGQVVALCLWFPLLFQGFYYLIIEACFMATVPVLSATEHAADIELRDQALDRE
jgi:hypothetical protein